MAQTELGPLVPDAPAALRAILDGALGAVQPPIRSEIFGLQRFAQHGRSLGLTHRAAEPGTRSATFVPRLEDNIRALRQAHGYIGKQASTGYDISPAAEWLLDNFHLIEAQLKEIREGLPRSYFRALPVLIDEPLAGLPRVYGVAWAFVAHTDGAFNEELLVAFLNAYQETRKLQLNELWALPTTLRVVLVENLRRLAQRVATQKAAREVANLCWDHIDSMSLDSLDKVLALMNQRGVGRVFLAQIGQRLQDLGSNPETPRPALLEWLLRALPDLAAAQAQHAADQASDNLSVSNALTSLRNIGDADWPDLIASTSGLMRVMLTSPLFEAEHTGTRDQTLHSIELLARRHQRDEVDIAAKLLELMRVHSANDAAIDPTSCSASYWLHGMGRPKLLLSLGIREPWASAWQAVARRLRLPVYLGSFLFFTLGLVAWMLLHHLQTAANGAITGWTLWLLAFLMLFPASEAVAALINRLISESARPRHLPRLALSDGIPPEHRVLVVIPAMLTSEAGIKELVHRLQLHYLANPERNAQFALLTDWADADTASLPGDEASLMSATAHIRELEARYAKGSSGYGDEAPRFILLHRPRSFSETEQRWIGWERKRGKLEQLIAALANGDTSAFVALGATSRIAPGTPYIVTLDSDTQLPPGRLRELVGVAAHPQNRPRLDAALRRVVSGYGILQPRVVTPLPAPRDFTPYHWLFAGKCGIDPYSAASSEVYQDLFGEGSFSGKGLLNVQAMYAVLDQRLPPGRVLSHDLLEGSLARCAAVTDINVIEDAPFHADVAASRVHRWTRGDWQLLPFLLNLRAYPLATINRWKLFDNLRRSLVAPMSLLLLLLVLGGGGLSLSSALALVAAAFLAGPLMGAVAGFSPSRDDLAREHFYRQAGIDLSRALAGGLWQLAQLLQNALLCADAIVRALYRMFVSRRHLLQWTTAAAAQAAAQTRLPALARRHWMEPLAAALLFGAIWLLPLDMPSPWSTVLLCAVWAAAPVWTWWVSRPNPRRQETALPVEDQAYLEGIARDTWRLFERCVGPAENHLPPDNLQTSPHDMLAHRTSPTNIGLYLLSAACARQFGWIGTQELLTRLEATLATLHRLPRHRGHFLNWYDTQRCEALLPIYVSTVDSGNLSGHLLAVAQACRELAHAPFDATAATRGLAMSKKRLAGLLAVTPPLAPLWPGRSEHAAWARLLALPADEVPAELSFGALLDLAAVELGALQQSSVDPPAVPDALLAPTQDNLLAWSLGDYLATLRSAWRDRRADSPEGRLDAVSRLRSIAHDCEQLAWQADFSFLYHPKRHLLHIGYRVAEQQRDAGFYDLLASESRLTSLLAIAKGDVPVAHWASLGRPFYAVGAVAGLRSWSGSMFEYLMPTLVLDEPHGSVLREACHAALREQIAYGEKQQVPWGISESAYAGSDHTLAYQYAPQGVPRLALRRTPPDELVIAPYATALAAQIAPHLSAQNYARLESMAPRARYGFIEALDFSRARQTGGGPFTPVDTFMAHHQGMSIVALANVLLGGPAQRWGMANPSIEAVASLLHERAPREVSKLYAPSNTPPALALQNRAPGLLREVLPGSSAVEPTHVLSNGRYNVSLRANGAGWSRWRQTGITRWRDDALRDAFGSFFYLRRPGDSIAPVSITQHPAPDAAAKYQSIYHADRVCFDAAWPLLQAHTTVWVSPEDDIEFRRVELRNLSDSPLDIELISAFEVTLSDPRADEAHPAFTNLFVRAEWLAAHQALLFERKPRLPTEHALRAAHFLTDADPQIVGLRVQTDRNRWQGRNQASGQPRAELDELPVSSPGADPAQGVVLDTGLDPVCVLAVRLRIAPQGKARLTFATAASDDAGTLRAVIDKYSQHSHVQRASLMSATLTGIRLRSLGIGSENFAAAQSLTTALLLSLARPRFGPPALPGQPGQNEPVFEGCDRRLLWRFGISGDRPIILVAAGVAEGVGMLRSLAQALRLWSWGGTACDLVVLNSEPSSYLMAMHREIAALRERTLAEISGEPGSAQIGFYLLRTEELSRDELGTLQCLARVRLNADGRPLLHHVEEWRKQHALASTQREESEGRSLASAPGRANAAAPSTGDFVPGSGEFRFQVTVYQRPLKPWINVLSNRSFGAQISEAGGGYTWAVNSRLNQLTAWSNDAVADAPSEWFLLQDRKTRAAWNVAPSAWGALGLDVSGEPTTYRVTHGQGYTRIAHRRGDLEVTASWCVDAATSVKQVHIRLVNRGHRTQQLRIVGIAEWIMGANRSDRGSTYTAMHQVNDRTTALLCTQRDRSAGFGEGTAFLATSTSDDAGEADWTCDRRELFDSSGRLQLPDRFGQQTGAGLDPCAALAVNVSLATGESVEHVFLLGYGDNPAKARALAQQAATTGAAERLEAVRSQWNTLLGSTTVKTPDPLFDALVNRWLLYQTVSCRLWAKAGFYQAGGATGFRDQLQDAMALAWAEPATLRAQIVLCASRQFPEGDVQHWWHAPTGAGVRTHFSDDLLWLAHATHHYLQATGDASLLDEQVPFLEGAGIPEHAEDAYYTPGISPQHVSVFEHAARAIDRSLVVGSHGLPLMGSGDWNDGMNRVGIKGKGESVWLGWFLCRLVEDFAPVAASRGETDRAVRWQHAADGWKAALQGTAWDGEWFKRAFFDDGTPLGSHVNSEARIDLIAQAWAVLSQAATPEQQRTAMAAVEAHLADHHADLVRLLDPPLDKAQPSAGYIQAYPPGVRENGGQYSHGAVWALMAQAELARQTADVDEDVAYRYFTYLSPAHRARHPVFGVAYAIEPYVMAGDVYTQPPYVGRGGWSWYTGSAAWMHRAAIESIFGLKQTAEQLRFEPCLPSHWPQAEITLRRGERSMRFILVRGGAEAALVAARLLSPDIPVQLLRLGETLRWDELAAQTCFVLPLA